jgi:hypothetical protein
VYNKKLVEIEGFLPKVPSKLNNREVKVLFRPIWQIAVMMAKDLRLAGNVILKAKSLYVILFCLWLINFLIFIANDNFVVAKEKVLFRSLSFVFVTIFILSIYEIWRYKKASQGSEDLTRFWIFYRTLAWISWLIDLVMIQLIAKYGIWMEMIIVNPPYILINVWIMIIYDKFYKDGVDLLYIDYLRTLPNRVEKNLVEKMSAWIIKSPVRVFIVGSTWFEPDIATLLLRKEKVTTFRMITTTTLPMAIICNTFWSVVFYFGVSGYSYFKWFIE